ncbi:MAG TPA: hypothetical protein VJ969_12320 [Desulfopila sp.]|nr:hypothetical protein [Desulfopila sp.]
MKEDLSRDFGFVLAVFFALLVCVSAAMTLNVLRRRSEAGREVLEGWLLEVVWINMPLFVVIVLALGWLIFRTELGFAATTSSISAGDNDRPYFSSTAILTASRWHDTLSDTQTQGSDNYHLRYLVTGRRLLPPNRE